MTVLNFTFQESSPLITYSPGGWTEGSAANDTFASSYNGSFIVTQVAGSSASFSFSGTAVSIFGATRPNHGNYTVNIDSQPQFAGVGFTAQNAFNKSLWHADDLGYTQHTVTLTNVPTTGGPFLDLDFVSIDRQIGQPGDNIFQETLDDTSPSVHFTGSWESTTDVSSAFGGTLHSTDTANDQVTISFQGCCVELYGQYANAPYTVVLDNIPPQSMQGLDIDLAPNFQHPQTLLYLVDGLSEDSNHTIALVNSDSNMNRPFFFDYAVISSTQKFNVTNTTNPNPSDASADHLANSTPIGAIAGGVLGGLVVLVLLGLGALLFVRRQRRHQRNAHVLDLMEDSEDSEPKPYIIPNAYGLQAEPYIYDRALPPLPRSSDSLSKFRPQVTVPASSSGPSEYLSPDGSISSEWQPESSDSTSYERTDSNTTRTRTAQSSSRSGTLSTEPSSRRDTKHHYSQSQSEAGKSSRQPLAAVHEEDAGLVLDPEETPVAKTLPPAYNPEWHHVDS